MVLSWVTIVGYNLRGRWHAQNFSTYDDRTSNASPDLVYYYQTQRLRSFFVLRGKETRMSRKYVHAGSEALPQATNRISTSNCAPTHTVSRSVGGSDETNDNYPQSSRAFLSFIVSGDPPAYAAIQFQRMVGQWIDR